MEGNRVTSQHEVYGKLILPVIGSPLSRSGKLLKVSLFGTCSGTSLWNAEKTLRTTGTLFLISEFSNFKHLWHDNFFKFPSWYYFYEKNLFYEKFIMMINFGFSKKFFSGLAVPQYYFHFFHGLIDTSCFSKYEAQ